jgi:hypothetical protein
MSATEIQWRTSLNAYASTGGNSASSIGMRGADGVVRRKFQLVMAAPDDKREHAVTIPKIETLRLHPSSALPSADREQNVAKRGNLSAPSVLASGIRDRPETWSSRPMRLCPKPKQY